MPHPVWTEWARIGRFLETGHKAFLETPEPDDEHRFYGSVLLHTYAVTEAAAAEALGRDPGTLNGIERWGWELLERQGCTRWPLGTHGAAGLAEVAVVRNAFAHSMFVVSRREHDRLMKAGGTARAVGSTIKLRYRTLTEYRRRLESLLRGAGFASGD